LHPDLGADGTRLPPAPTTVRTAQRPPLPPPSYDEPRDAIPRERQEHPRFSWGTEKDHRFADFLRDNSGGMVREAAVGLEKRGLVRVELDRSVAPDDTLDLTRSVLAGARRDFSDQPITLKVYDPSGDLILRAYHRPGHGVHSGAPRRDVEAGVGEAFHPEQLSPDQAEPQCRAAAQRMQPSERAEIAQDLMSGLQERGLAPCWLQKLLGLGSADPNRASPDDVARLTEYSRQNHPEVFRRVVADKPFFVRWMNKPLVAGLVGIIAGKLLNRAYDR
jgi:hypothetical protein